MPDTSFNHRDVKTAIVTGITGQDGSYLYKSLLADNYKIIGTSRKTTVDCKNFDQLGLPPAEVVTLQITDPDEVYNLMEATRPDELYLLAAHSSVGDSWTYSVETMKTNYLSTLNFLEAVRKLGLQTRVFIASSSDMYGNALQDQQDESGPFDPVSPYGLSKLAAHNLVELYREAYGVFVCSGIMFNHESPIRGAKFVTSKICNGLFQFKFSNGPSVKLGNINAKRDFGYAPDFVSGMRKMMQQDAPNDFVLATGQSRSIRDFIKCAAACLDLELEWSGTGLQEYAIDTATGKKAIEISKQFFRECDIKETNGNSAKAQAQLGWAPTLTFEELVGELLNSRERTKIDCH